MNQLCREMNHLVPCILSLVARRCRAFSSLMLLLLAGMSLQAQTDLTRVHGTSDTDIPTPVHSLKTISDVAAIEGIINFVKLTGISGWKGAVAKGTITFADDTLYYPATVSLLGGRRTRLDVKKESGTESTVFNGAVGIFESVSGTHISISSDISTIGLFAFARLLSTEYPLKTTVFSDQGTITISGKPLQRVTLDDPSTDTRGARFKSVDLYFDPATGRLTDSVALVHLSSSDAALYVLETTYSDYQTVGRVTLPYTYTQRLNGQLQWTLSLTSIDPSTIPDASLFTF